VTGTGNTITMTSCNAGTTHPDTKISVFCGTCLEPVCVAGNDDDCPSGGPIFASTVSWCSQPGVEYLVTIGGFAPGQVGFVQLDVTDDGTPCVPEVECLPTGACCLLDGTCIQVTSDACAAAGGTYQGDGTDCVSNAIADGGFEGGAFGGYWTEFSTNFGTPLCDASCGFGGGTGPHSGDWWSWFGGIFAFEEGSVSQAVTIPVGALTLDFWLEIPVSSGNGVDFLEVTIDGTQIFNVLESDGTGPGYLPISVPLGPYADGGVHTVEFHSIITGDDGSGGAALTNFFVDDTAINSVEVDCIVPPTCFTLDFETDDVGNALGDKQRIDDEFDGGPNYPVTITGTSYVSTCGSVSHTAAIYDSDAPEHGQDPDLAVDSGNILIVQSETNLNECPAGSGFFCSGNDDPDGGIVTFVFGGPVETLSIDLIDVDLSGPDEVLTVTMTDALLNTRTYTVPVNWTGDHIDNPGEGQRTLALNTTAPQPGFSGSATAVQDPGFDQTAVVSIVVERGGDCAGSQGGSGALDNLVWCQ
jgi:hypothetical protein